MRAHIGKALICAATLLAACTPLGNPATSLTPQARPAGLAPVAPAAPSAQSKALAQYYQRVQADLLAQGLMRMDGGGPDTPFTSTDLVRNFETLAFFDEYQRGAGLRQDRGGPGFLRRWNEPVRFGVEFGASVPQSQRAQDGVLVASYVSRLARVTGHPMSMSGNPNFHVLFMGEDDRQQMLTRVRQIVPNVSPSSIQILQDIPRSIHCLVVAFSATNDDSDYRKAIAIIRSEHPSLMRKACVHEELAQGLGLANDSPQARPSIFNDDDEFALLTTQDELLLKMLYDPRLRGGMTLREARPFIRQMAATLAGGST